MSEKTGTTIMLLGGIGLILAIVSLVTPWWAVEGAAGGFSGEVKAQPFDAGLGEGDLVSQGGVIAVGVILLFGIVATAGGMALWARAKQTGEDLVEVAPWLLIAGGGLYIIGAVAAVLTWPAGDLGFWDSAGGGTASFQAAASVGWYLALVAGALIGAGGIMGMDPEDRADEPAA